MRLDHLLSMEKRKCKSFQKSKVKITGMSAERCLILKVLERTGGARLKIESGKWKI